jgi:hypothetical protein
VRVWVGGRGHGWGKVAFHLALALFSATPAPGAARSARVQWRPSAAAGVAGYRLYTRTPAGSYGPGLNAGLPTVAGDGTMSQLVPGLDDATSYLFAVTAYAAGGAESGLSNEILLPGTGTSGTTSTTTIASPSTTTTVAGGCAATVIPAGGGTFTGATSGASVVAPSCNPTGNSPERVYHWTPSVSGTALIQTCSTTATTYDTVLSVRRGGCTGTELVCNDDTTGCGTTTDVSNPHRGSRVSVAVTAGQTYAIVVDGFNGASGNFSLAVTPPTAAGNCASPVVIPATGGTFTGTTSGASSLAGTCAATSTAGERVYQWTPSLSGTATIDTCSTTATRYDTVLYVRSNSCGGAQLACNDDTTGCGTTTDVSNPHRGSKVTTSITAGQTYFIVVDGYNGSSGNFTLHVTPPGGAVITLPTTPTTTEPKVTSPRDAEIICGAPGTCRQATWDPVAGCGTVALADGVPCAEIDPCGSGSCAAGECISTSGAVAFRTLDVLKLLLRPLRNGTRLLAHAAFVPGTDVTPDTTGVHVALWDPDGTPLFEADLPGSAFAVNRARTRFRYKLRRAAKAPPGSEGLERLVLRSRGGRFDANLTARLPGMDLAAVSSRVVLAVRLDAECARDLDVACNPGGGSLRCVSGAVGAEAAE